MLRLTVRHVRRFRTAKIGDHSNAPSSRVEMGVLYRVLTPQGLSARYGYTTSCRRKASGRRLGSIPYEARAWRWSIARTWPTLSDASPGCQTLRHRLGYEPVQHPGAPRRHLDVGRMADAMEDV